MVKLTNMVVGLVLFSVVVSMFFLTVADILRRNNIEGYETFEELGGKYYGSSKEVTDADSNLRDIQEASQLGAGATTDEPDVSALQGALSGGKLAINFITNFENIMNNATGDVNDEGETYIHPNIKNGVLAIVSIIIVSFCV